MHVYCHNVAFWPIFSCGTHFRDRQARWSRDRRIMLAGLHTFLLLAAATGIILQLLLNY